MEEDFGPVLWILIVVGAIAYNAVAQARKKAGKQGRTTENPVPGEAWPSWDTVSAPEPRQQPVPRVPAESVYPTPETLETVPDAAEGRVYGQYQTVFEDRHAASTQQEAPSRRLSNTRASAQRARIRSAGTECDAPSTHASESFRTAGTRPDGASDPASDPTEDTQDLTHQPSPENQHAAAGEMPDDLLDRFDLRTAVIYSEILKPKFEE